jgi:hypothetical protein
MYHTKLQNLLKESVHRGINDCEASLHGECFDRALANYHLIDGGLNHTHAMMTNMQYRQNHLRTTGTCAEVH